MPYYRIIPLDQIRIGGHYMVYATENRNGLPVYLNKPLGEQASWRVPELGKIIVISGPRDDAWFLVDYQGPENVSQTDIWIEGRGHFAEWIAEQPPAPPAEPWITIWEFTLFGVDVRLQRLG